MGSGEGADGLCGDTRRNHGHGDVERVEVLRARHRYEHQHGSERAGGGLGAPHDRGWTWGRREGAPALGRSRGWSAAAGCPAERARAGDEGPGTVADVGVLELLEGKLGPGRDCGREQQRDQRAPQAGCGRRHEGPDAASRGPRARPTPVLAPAARRRMLAVGSTRPSAGGGRGEFVVQRLLYYGSSLLARVRPTWPKHFSTVAKFINFWRLAKHPTGLAGTGGRRARSSNPHTFHGLLHARRAIRFHVPGE